jgi:transposase
LDRYEADGIAGLEIDAGRGRKSAFWPKTPREARQEVKTLLAQTPRQHDVADRSRWRLQDIGAAISWLQDKTISGIQQVLKRLGIVRKRGIPFIRSPDPDFRLKRRRIAAAFIEALLNEDVIILFQDELSYYQQPDGALDYGEEGDSQPLVDRAPGANQLTRIGAVLNGLTGRVIYKQGKKFGKAAMCQLYREIRRAYPEQKIYVVQDNFPAVHKHEDTLQTAAELEIIPLFLPTYASWLNPIEKLWRWLKDTLLHAHEWAHDIQQLRQEVCDRLDQFDQGSDALLRYVGLLPD